MSAPEPADIDARLAAIEASLGQIQEWVAGLDDRLADVEMNAQ